MKIELKDCTKANTCADPVGFIIQYTDRIFRVIHPEAEENIRSFLKSELFHILQNDKWLPVTRIAEEVEIDGYHLILEHETIPFVTAPYEWTFNMFKDAALFLLELDKLCKKHGYCLKDLHPWNVTFLSGRPIFMDLGSIVRIETQVSSAAEFLRDCYVPLKLWSKGFFYWAHRLISDDYPNRLVTYNYSIYKFNPFFMIEYLYLIFRRIINFPIRTITGNNILPLYYNSLMRIRISRLKRYRKESLWGKYHSNLDNFTNCRFSAIIQMLKKYHISSSVDLACNQGAFTKQLIKDNKTLKFAVCIDYDEEALDQLYLSEKKNIQTKIVPIMRNIIYPVSALSQNKLRHTEQGEIVFALALTHHLILTQKISIMEIFSILASYTTKYILVEFMPEGLWDGVSAPPVPDWYTEKWFEENFKKKFYLLEKKNIARNRIAFLGIKKHDQQIIYT